MATEKHIPRDWRMNIHKVDLSEKVATNVFDPHSARLTIIFGVASSYNRSPKRNAMMIAIHRQRDPLTSRCTKLRERSRGLSSRENRGVQTKPNKSRRVELHERRNERRRKRENHKYGQRNYKGGRGVTIDRQMRKCTSRKPRSLRSPWENWSDINIHTIGRESIPISWMRARAGICKRDIRGSWDDRARPVVAMSGQTDIFEAFDGACDLSVFIFVPKPRRPAGRF